MVVRRIARPLLAGVFVVDGLYTLTHPQPSIAVTEDLVLRGQRALPDPLAARIPEDAGTMVRANAAARVIGGTLLALGRLPRLSAAVIAATVVPSTIVQQSFPTDGDPALRAAKRQALLKDLGLLGGLLIAATDAKGTPTWTERGHNAALHVESAAQRAAGAVTAALPAAGAVVAEHAPIWRQRGEEAAQRVATVVSTTIPEATAAVAEHAPIWRQRGEEAAQRVATVVSNAMPDATAAVAEHAPIWRQRGEEAAQRVATVVSNAMPDATAAVAEHAPVWRRRGEEAAQRVATALPAYGAVVADSAREAGQWLHSEADRLRDTVVATPAPAKSRRGRRRGRRRR
ncbi:DoxX family protein [Nocardia stercoris]|uniref:DoxX family membrane protein n=1 Tax=Nocardia stercoris TaxID=2483361 RepID=A0A3M2KV91_9NOCA|nr:DoxX family protein [Nocardia stercoris]RMI28596.1 DoxX family membrane protein [Nocardia stercoris]